MAPKKQQPPKLQDFPAHEQILIQAIMPQIDLLHSMLPDFRTCGSCRDCWAYKIAVINTGTGPVTLCHAVSALQTTIKALAANQTGK